MLRSGQRLAASPGWRHNSMSVDLSTLRTAELRIQCTDNEGDDGASGTRNENAEERSLICLRRENHGTEKAERKSDETEHYSASKRISQ